MSVDVQKNLEEKINAAKEYLVENPEDMKG